LAELQRKRNYKKERNADCQFLFRKKIADRQKAKEMFFLAMPKKKKKVPTRANVN